MQTGLFRALVFSLPLVAAAGPVFAATLSISSRSSLTISAERLQVNVLAENSGTEPAYQVQAFLNVFDNRYDNDITVDLPATQSRIFQFAIPLPPGQEGDFPFVGEVVFHDARRLPFTALTAGTFKLGAAQDGRIAAAAPEIQIADSGQLTVWISNRDANALELALTLYLPGALITPQKRKNLRLDPFESATVDFPLTCRSGTGAAVYPVYCTLSASAAGKQKAAVVQSAVHIKAFENWFFRTRWHWLGGGIFVLLGWIVAGAAGHKRAG